MSLDFSSNYLFCWKHILSKINIEYDEDIIVKISKNNTLCYNDILLLVKKAYFISNNNTKGGFYNSVEKLCNNFKNTNSTPILFGKDRILK